MKTSSTDRLIFNEFNLLQEKNLQHKHQFEFSSTSSSQLLPKNPSQTNTSASSSASELIVSLRFKKQTKWIHRHRHQTVLSRKSQLLSVGCIPILYIAILKSICCSNPHQNIPNTFYWLEHHLRAWSIHTIVVFISVVQLPMLCACQKLPASLFFSF